MLQDACLQDLPRRLELSELDRADMCKSRHAIRPQGLAEILSDIGSKPVPFKIAWDQDHIAHLMAVGLPASC